MEERKREEGKIKLSRVVNKSDIERLVITWTNCRRVSGAAYILRSSTWALRHQADHKCNKNLSHFDTANLRYHPLNGSTTHRQNAAMIHTTYNKLRVEKLHQKVNSKACTAKFTYQKVTSCDKCQAFQVINNSLCSALLLFFVDEKWHISASFIELLWYAKREWAARNRARQAGIIHTWFRRSKGEKSTYMTVRTTTWARKAAATVCDNRISMV